jgi:hypothetical protein
MDVSGQLHAPYGKSPWYPLDRRFGGPQNLSESPLPKEPKESYLHNGYRYVMDIGPYDLHVKVLYGGQ